MTRTTATTRHGATTRRLTAFACALAAALVPAGAAHARLGDLDASFGGDGIATVGNGGQFEAVAPRSGGGAAAAGWFTNGQGLNQAFAAQLQSDGQPDPAFGSSGAIALPAARAYGVAVDASQRVLVAGHRAIPGATSLPTVFRVGPTGTVEGPFDIPGLGEAQAVIALPDGMLVGGWRGGSAQRDVFFVARLDASGAPVLGFGVRGVAEADFGVAARAFAMAADAAGRIVLAGTAGSQTALARFTPGGTPDETFDGDGELVLGPGELRAVAVDGIGRITAAGVSDRALVVRRQADGAPDFTTVGSQDGSALSGLVLDGARSLVAGRDGAAQLMLGSLDGAGAPEPALSWRSFPGATEALGAAPGPDRTVYTAGGPPAFVSRHAPNAPPAAALSGPSQVLVGEPGAFDAGGSSDPEGEALRYAFDLDGDGSYEFDGGTNPFALRSFPAPGGYSVGVRVTDPRGASATAARAVTVVAAPGPPLPQPILGKQGVAQPLRGIVRVRLPGTKRFVRLTELTAIPNGTEIDARKGRLLITVLHDASGLLDGARFRAGRFVFSQGAGATPITTLKLTGGSFRNCTIKARSSALAVISSVKGGTGTRSKRRVRKLWGNGRGRFRTRGRYGAATVRGTKWLTLDRCDGTKVRVVRGKVSVRDLVRPRRRPKLVTAGGQTLVPYKR
jgi:uncharacterized delta-60 repeat protein